MIHLYINNKKLFLTGVALLILSVTMAQKQDTTAYPVVIQFQSMCCGVPSDAPLRSFIKGFRKKNKIKKITAWHIGPMGKEGEYWLAFSLKEMTRKQAAAFKKQAKPIVEGLKDKGSAVYNQDFIVVKSELPGRSAMAKVSF